MTHRQMDGVGFEQLLSFRPVLQDRLAFAQPPLRDAAISKPDEDAAK